MTFGRVAKFEDGFDVIESEGFEISTEGCEGAADETAAQGEMERG